MTDRLVVKQPAHVQDRRAELLRNAKEAKIDAALLTPPKVAEPEPDAQSIEAQAAKVGKTHEFTALVLVPSLGEHREFQVTSKVPSPGDWLTVARLELQLAQVRLDALSAEMRDYIAKLARITVMMEMPHDLWELAQVDVKLLTDLWGASVAHEALYFRGRGPEGGPQAPGGLLEVHSPVGDIRQLLEKYLARPGKPR